MLPLTDSRIPKPKQPKPFRIPLPNRPKTNEKGYGNCLQSSKTRGRGLPTAGRRAFRRKSATTVSRANKNRKEKEEYEKITLKWKHSPINTKKAEAFTHFLPMLRRKMQPSTEMKQTNEEACWNRENKKKEWRKEQ